MSATSPHQQIRLEAPDSRRSHVDDHRECVNEHPDFQKWLREIASDRHLRRYCHMTVARRPLSKVYYFRRADGAIKIGHSAHLADRMRHLRAKPGGELLATEPGWFSEERWRQFQFRCTDLGGEWFSPSRPLLAHIETLAGAK